RGLGLGIVSEKVDKLGGHVEVDSEKNRGVTFRLILPLTLATFRGIQISVGRHKFIMPGHNVKRVIRLKPTDIYTLESCMTISLEGQALPFVRLADLFNLPAEENREETSLFALIVKGEERTIAFGADKVHGENEVLVKGLGSQCIRVRN